MTTAERLLREWVEWYDRGDPKYMAPKGMTIRFLTEVQAREQSRRSGSR